MANNKRNYLETKEKRKAKEIYSNFCLIFFVGNELSEHVNISKYCRWLERESNSSVIGYTE